MKINFTLRPQHILPKIKRLWDLSGAKISLIERMNDPAKGSPVFTVRGVYTARGWTEWTQGFQYGSALLQFDATGDAAFLEIGRRNTVEKMAAHVSHVGVHDHGFNNVSTYGNLLRLMNEGRIAENAWERNFYELALKLSGAIQARRWTSIPGGGFIYSFNGPHSLFVDTIRSLRSLAVAHRLGHVLMEENDRRVSLLDRLKAHAASTATWSVYYGKGRDAYDVRGRVAHEAIFNVNDGNFRCPNSQQGYSPFSTWTRGLAWAMCGFAEQLEFLDAIGDAEITPLLLEAARATCDFYIEQRHAADGIPYWDTGAPNLHRLGDWQSRPADPFNPYEPVDSSAAAIAAQGLLRLGPLPEERALLAGGADRARHAARRAVSERRSEASRADPAQRLSPAQRLGLRPHGRSVPCGESSMWGDYHAREAALYVQRIAENKPYLTFWGESA